MHEQKYLDIKMTAFWTTYQGKKNGLIHKDSNNVVKEKPIKQ